MLALSQQHVSIAIDAGRGSECLLVVQDRGSLALQPVFIATEAEQSLFQLHKDRWDYSNERNGA